jgi:hypothetical protein
MKYNCSINRVNDKFRCNLSEKNAFLIKAKHVQTLFDLIIKLSFNKRV